MLSEDAIDQDSENRAPEVVFANSQPGVGVVPTVKQQPSKKPEQASLPNQPLPTARSKFVKIAPKPTDDVAVVVTSSAPSNVVASVCVPAAPAKAATKAARASASTKPALPKSQPSGDASLGKNKRQSLLLNWLKPAAASSMQSAVNGTPSVIALEPTMLASGTVRPATPSEDIVVEIISVKKGPAVVIPAVQRKPDAVSALSSVDPDDVDFKTNVDHTEKPIINEPAAGAGEKKQLQLDGFGKFLKPHAEEPTRPTPFSKRVRDDLEIDQNKPLPQLERLDVVAVNGEVLSMSDYLRLLAVYEFIVSYRDLFQEEADDVDIEDDTPTLANFEVALSKSGDWVWLVDILQPLLFQLISEQLPAIDYLTFQGLFAMFLAEEDAQLAVVFEQVDFPMIPLGDKVRALDLLVNEVCNCELFDEHVRQAMSRRMDVLTDKTEKRRRRLTILTELPLLEEKLNALRPELASETLIVQNHTEQLEMEWKEIAKKHTDELTSAGRMSARQIEQAIGRKRDAFFEERQKEIDNRAAGLASIEEKIVETEATIEAFKAERTKIEEYLACGDKDVLTLVSVRNQNATLLGSDRFGRIYWHVKTIGGVLVEDPMDVDATPAPVDAADTTRHHYLIRNDQQLNEVVAALNTAGSREKQLRRGLDAHMETLLTSFVNCKEWELAHVGETAASCVTIVSSEFSAVDELKEAVGEAERLLATIFAYSTLGHKHEMVDSAQAAIFLANADSALTARDAETLVDVIRCIDDRLLRPLGNFFFPPRQGCRMCELHVSSSDDTPMANADPALAARSSSFWRWYRCLHAPKSVSALAIVVQHMHTHLERLLEMLEQRYGVLKQERPNRSMNARKLMSPKRKAKVAAGGRRGLRSAVGAVNYREEVAEETSDTDESLPSDTDMDGRRKLRKTTIKATRMSKPVPMKRQLRVQGRDGRGRNVENDARAANSSAEEEESGSSEEEVVVLRQSKRVRA